jgi:hypothetical protein
LVGLDNQPNVTVPSSPPPPPPSTPVADVPEAVLATAVVPEDVERKLIVSEERAQLMEEIRHGRTLKRVASDPEKRRPPTAKTPAPRNSMLDSLYDVMEKRRRALNDSTDSL